MRKLLFLGLLLLTLGCRSQGFLPVASVAQGGNVITQVGPITVTFKHSQRTDAAITVSATATSQATSWYWELYKVTDWKTKVLYNISFDEDPTFNGISVEGFYDLTLVAKNANDKWTQRWDDAFIVQRPQFTEAQADIVIDITSANYFHDFANADMSDKKIYLKGTGTHYFQPYRLTGTAGHEVRIQVDPTNGVHLTTPAGVSQGYWLNQCSYVHTDGYLSDGSRGLNLQALDPNTAQVLMVYGSNFSHMGIAGATVYMDRASMTSGSAAIAFIPATPDATYNSATFLSTDNYVYDNSVTQAKDEGLYNMFNNDNLQGSYRPIKAYNTCIAWNSFTNTGRDGIQVASTILGRVHNNYINTCGLNHTSSQESLISWNSGNSDCWVYNNFGANAEMLLNIQMGNNPFNTFAGETTPGPLYITGNIFRVGTYSPGGSTEPDAIYIQNESAVTGTGTWVLNIVHNVFFTEDKWNAESYSFTGSSAISHKWANNIIVKSGTNSGRTAPELNYAGPNNNQTRSLNNLVYDYPSYTAVLFTNVAGNDFTLSSFSSSAYGGSPTNTASTFTGLPYFNDNAGYPLLAPGQAYTFGAYSGYEKRFVAPTVSDINPATFTTPVTVTSLTESTGTLGYESNKIGTLFWIVSSVDAAPTRAQIRAGKLASGSAALFSGNLIDVGTVTASQITGMTESNNYYLFCVFVTQENIEQTSVTRVAFSTAADTTAPTISGFNISDGSRTHVNFTSSEYITGTTFSNFTISGKTISSIFINSGSTTGHYFVTSTAFIFTDAPTIAYSGGNNWKDVSVAQNSLASFGSTAITNNIQPAAEANVIWVDGSNVSISGNNVSSTTSSANARSSQIIPAASNGYVEFDWATITRSNGGGARIGLIASTDARTAANIKLALDVHANNENVDVYVNGTYNPPGVTISNNQSSAGVVAYRIKIDRVTQHMIYYSTTDRANYTLKYESTATFTGDFRVAYVSNDATKGGVNVIIQADLGLQ